MYESYYGFSEKPFSLTPDPKYLYRSESHANAFDLLQYAIRRREGFVVVTGDIGTGKTTLCRALLEQIDRTPPRDRQQAGVDRAAVRLPALTDSAQGERGAHHRRGAEPPPAGARADPHP